MKKIITLLTVCLFFACSTEEKQLETVRALAIKDLQIQLQLPEGTKFDQKDIKVSEKESDIESIESVYVVTFNIKSQDREGNEVVKTHTLEYEKIGEGGLSPDDYELKSFN